MTQRVPLHVNVYNAQSGQGEPLHTPPLANRAPNSAPMTIHCSNFSPFLRAAVAAVVRYRRGGPGLLPWLLPPMLRTVRPHSRKCPWKREYPAAAAAAPTCRWRGARGCRSSSRRVAAGSCWRPARQPSPHPARRCCHCLAWWRGRASLPRRLRGNKSAVDDRSRRRRRGRAEGRPCRGRCAPAPRRRCSRGTACALLQTRKGALAWLAASDDAAKQLPKVQSTRAGRVALQRRRRTNRGGSGDLMESSGRLGM
eukprot:365651-Chlamydomonas_euryale.AAC.6